MRLLGARHAFGSVLGQHVAGPRDEGSEGQRGIETDAGGEAILADRFHRLRPGGRRATHGPMAVIGGVMTEAVVAIEIEVGQLAAVPGGR